MCSEDIERTVEELQSNIENVVNGRDYVSVDNNNNYVLSLS